MARVVEDLVVYQRALAADEALILVVRQPHFRPDRDLMGQLTSASVRIISNIAEGFEQKTDKHFAHYLYGACGSAAEIRRQLIVARNRGYVSANDCSRVGGLYEEIARMLRGLIGHLEREDRKDRRGSKRTREPKPDDL